MASVVEYAAVMGGLYDELRTARDLQQRLFNKVIAGACIPLPLLSRLGRAGKMDRLAEAFAWTDAALVLVALELPAWKVRRRRPCTDPTGAYK